MIPVSMVVYWMMIFCLKEGDTCVNSGLLNDDILIKTNMSMVVYWMMILWVLMGQQGKELYINEWGILMGQ